ncbi:hypothetical protein CDL15_Pgr026463 [Punica granatum]|uniref:Uncharacterized protein n=1 Tax=Punica granatum TaxID=22663 RepID=A0A218WAD1_PUNGR|nr:hypothetical protein CDL15_Pgr005975 [Punica granatum]OWM69310.1 hypothetical protein CDL15_Pgr026463 [Punica granatum]
MLCPWGGGVFDLPEAGFAARAVTLCPVGCQLCHSGDCSSLGTPGCAMRDSNSGVECLRIPRSRESESAVVPAFVVLVILTSLVSHEITSDLGPDVRPPGLLLALHGHIETFSKVPKRLYRLFDAPVNLGPFLSRCRRAAAFVTRMGNFVQIWSDLGLVIFRVL